MKSLNEFFRLWLSRKKRVMILIVVLLDSKRFNGNLNDEASLVIGRSRRFARNFVELYPSSWLDQIGFTVLSEKADSASVNQSRFELSAYKNVDAKSGDLAERRVAADYFRTNAIPAITFSLEMCRVLSCANNIFEISPHSEVPISFPLSLESFISKPIPLDKYYLWR